MMAEFAAYYGGAPGPELAWPLFTALVKRAHMFEARRQLAARLGTSGGIGAAFGEGDDGQRLFESAYPVKVMRSVQRWIKNQANDGGSGGH